MSNPEPVEELAERYKAAVHTKDLEGFMALYAKDVRVFDSWGRWAYQGTGEWRGMAAEWLVSLDSEKVTVEFHDLQTVSGDNVAAGHAFVSFKRLSADGEVLRTIDNRLTWVLQKTPEGEWKIINEHTSAPVVGGKITLRRPPQTPQPDEHN